MAAAMSCDRRIELRLFIRANEWQLFGRHGNWT
jgi:hypothetical protein